MRASNCPCDCSPPCLWVFPELRQPLRRNSSWKRIGRSARATGIPRLSRLPVPNKPSSIRPPPSRDDNAGAGELRIPKLRTSASRDHLSSAGSLRRKDPPASPPFNLHTAQPFAQPSPRTRVPSSQATRPARAFENKPNNHALSTPPRPVEPPAQKKPITLNRRTSQQFRAAAVSAPAAENALGSQNPIDGNLGQPDITGVGGSFAHGTVRGKAVQATAVALRADY